MLTDVIDSLEWDVFPDLGTETLKDIIPANVLDVLSKIERHPALETARRVRQRMSAVFVYTISCGPANNNSAAIGKKAIAPIKKGRRPLDTMETTI